MISANSSLNEGWGASRVSPTSKNTARKRCSGMAAAYPRALLEPNRSRSSAHRVSTPASRSARLPPSGPATPGPNRSRTALTAAPPGARISWAMRSASRTTAPRAARRRAALDFPEPIPPDRPMRITARWQVLPLEVPLHLLEDRLQRLAGLRNRRRKELALERGLGLGWLLLGCRLRCGLLGNTLGRDRLGCHLGVGPRSRGAGFRGDVRLGGDLGPGRGRVGGRCLLPLDLRRGRGLAAERLLHREADTPAVEVDVDDLHRHLLAEGHHLLGKLDMAFRKLGDVDQAFDTLRDRHEGAEGDH